MKYFHRHIQSRSRQSQKNWQNATEYNWFHKFFLEFISRWSSKNVNVSGIHIKEITSWSSHAAPTNRSSVALIFFDLWSLHTYSSEWIVCRHKAADLMGSSSFQQLQVLIERIKPIWQIDQKHVVRKISNLLIRIWLRIPVWLNFIESFINYHQLLAIYCHFLRFVCDFSGLNFEIYKILSPAHRSPTTQLDWTKLGVRYMSANHQIFHNEKKKKLRYFTQFDVNKKSIKISEI